MNTEATEDKSNVNSTGERLRSAREQMGLTQQNVAERLCLKLSTIRDIEEDNSPDSLASTFLRGYIRSYARLVRVPEEELLPMMAKQAPVRAAKVEIMQSYSLGKRRKKRDGWITVLTWLVLFVVVGLTGAWWWQNHKAAQDDLVSMADKNASVGAGDAQSIPLNAGNASSSGAPASVALDHAADSATMPAPANSTAPASPAQESKTSAASAAVTAPLASDSAQPAAVAPPQAAANAAASQLPTASAGINQPPVDPYALLLNFTRDCWLDVTDATGKKLLSGMQRSGGKLSLVGKAPYRLKIGAPAAVQIEYQGKPVDLSRFIRTNQVARLTVGAP